MLENLKKDLRKYRNKEKAKLLARFFKTGQGQYGEGDIFLGVTVPNSRLVARKYKNLPLSSIEKLIESKIHEERLVAVLILVEKYKNENEKSKKEIFEFYLAHAKNIDNWDLVDLSAPRIVGEYLRLRDKSVLLKLAQSKNLWEKRIAALSTFQFIYFGESEWTYKIVKILLRDQHDLIHKACGWMLREAGKRVSESELENFLKKNVKNMPRTMLRYAIERLPERKRKYYLKLK
jgi:3-methyladenine DNA glycosylase AlkD